MTMREYDRKVMLRLWRRRLRAAGAFVGDVAAAALFALLAWAFVWLTPPQSSAINDLEEEGATERTQQNQKARP